MDDTFFTDLHNHVIFSIDDGAENLDNSMLMVEQAAECNVHTIVATPHITDLTDDLIVKRIKKHYEELKNAISKRKIPVDLVLASELIYSDQIFDWLKKSWVTFNSNRKYFLFELPLFDLPNGVGDFIFQVKLKGFEPILAHPERYIYLHKKIDQLIQWRQQGCLMQMNAGSLTGQFGNEVLSITKKFLAANFFTFVASDAHDVDSRSFKVLPKAFEIVSDLVSQEIADDLFKTNPHKAVKGESISQLFLDEDIIEKHWFDGIIKSLKKFKLH